jgi:hypothetical protein
MDGSMVTPIVRPIPIQKKRVRAFRGLAGSPLSTTETVVLPAAPQRGRGRPKKFANEAAKKRAYRAEATAEKRMNEGIAQIKSEHGDYRGMYLTDADHGKGKLASGGYDSEKLSLVSGLREAEELECNNPDRPLEAHEAIWLESGARRKVHPEGFGKEVEDTPRNSLPSESAYTFQNDEKFRIPKNERVNAVERDYRVRMVREMFCSVHSEYLGTDRDGMQLRRPVSVTEITKVGKIWMFALECGCVRWLEIRKVNGVVGNIGTAA